MLELIKDQYQYIPQGVGDTHYVPTRANEVWMNQIANIILSGSGSSSPPSTLSPVENAFRAYLQGIKDSTGLLILLSIGTESYSVTREDEDEQPQYKTVFQIVFNKLVMESLCRILPKPFIDFHFRVGEMSIKQRFELQDLLNYTDERFEGHKCTQNVQFPDAINALFQEQSCCHFDIMLGWETGIKLEAATMVQNLLENESTKDLTLVPGKGSVVKCHKMIFAAQSPVLSEMVANGTKRFWNKNQIKMAANSEDGIKLLVRYLYGLEINIQELPSELIFELFKTAQMCGLDQLQSYLKNYLPSQDGRGMVHN